MPKKTERDQGEAAARLARWAGALSEAEMALAGGEPQEAERRAKAISARCCQFGANLSLLRGRFGPLGRAFHDAASNVQGAQVSA